LDISLEKKDASNALIKIKVNQGDYQPKVDQKIKDYAKKASIKGFRPGKVPPGMIKKIYGKSIVVEEVNQLLSESLTQYIKESDLQLVGEPLPVKDTIERLDWENLSDFEVDYEIGTVDEFTVDISKKNTVKAYEIKVDDKLIDETIDNLRNQNATLEDVEVSTGESQLYGKLTLPESDFETETTISAQVVGEKEFKKFVKKKPHEEVKFELDKLADTAAKKSELLGVDPAEVSSYNGKGSFTIKKIKDRAPAELNQEFFDRLFGKDAVDSVDAFREKVSEIISTNYATETQNLLSRDIQNTLIEKSKISLPDEFLKKWLSETNENLSQEDIDKEYDAFARGLKWNLITDKVAKENELSIEHKDVIEQAKALFRQQFANSGMGMAMEDKLDEFADHYLKAENGKNYRQVYEQTHNQKVMGFIKDSLTIKNEKVSFDKFKKLAEN
jgi:trigger factor